VTSHWGLPDPAAVEGSDEEKRRAFREAFLVLKRRISLLASLPVSELDELALRERLRQIGRE
jgi:arsenate reductase (thioredoxin)